MGEVSPVVKTVGIEDIPFATPSLLKPKMYRMNLGKSLNDQRINRNGSKHVKCASRSGVRMSSGFPEMHSRAPAAIYGCLIARKERVVCFQWRVLNGEEKAKTNTNY